MAPPAWLRAWSARLAEQAASVAPLAGHFEPVGEGPTLRLGDRSDRVVRLRSALAFHGFPGGDENVDADLFDAGLETRVAAYQSARGLMVDGVVGRQTRKSLDIGPVEQLQAIEASLAALRQLATDGTVAHADMVVVNLASQELFRIKEGQVVSVMKVAVGRPSRRTPLLADHITHVVLNPTWTVPPGILRKDKLPALRETGHPGIENASVFLDGEPVEDLTLVDWSAVSPGRVRIVQAAGAGNALGVVKFHLTNADNIYLHDTDSPRVFARDDRAVSSGCVRLSEPLVLAEDLLASEGWTRDELDAAIAAGRTRWVGLSKPVPVRFIYLPALPTLDLQEVKVVPDVYGLLQGA